MSEPRGPVYLTLPREVLADPAVAPRRSTCRPLGASPAEPSRGAIEEAARPDRQGRVSADHHLGRRAQAGGDGGARRAGRGIRAAGGAERGARHQPADRPSDVSRLRRPAPCCRKADVVLVLDARCRGSRAPCAEARRQDHPLRGRSAVARYPFREFEADLLITGEARARCRCCAKPCGRRSRRATASTRRRKALAAVREEMVAQAPRSSLEPVQDATPIHPAYRACLNELKAKDAIIVNELGLPVSQLDLTKPRSYLGGLLSGGLGFGLGAALGAKLAAPEREVIVDRRRRLLHVRQSAAVPLCRPRREAADAHHHRQQPGLGRGAPGDARRLSRTATPPRPTSCR